MFKDKVELKDYDKMDPEYWDLLGRVLTIQSVWTVDPSNARFIRRPRSGLTKRREPRRIMTGKNSVQGGSLSLTQGVMRHKGLNPS